MPLSKGPTEHGHMLQAQEQGAGTMPQRHRSWQGMPSLSIQEGERGNWGKLPWAQGFGRHSWAPLVLGGLPKKA